MAILRSTDGRFYDVPDEQLEDKLIPPDQLKERLGDIDPGGMAGEGDVQAHGWCWRRNYFRNYWRRNCWRNHCWRNHCYW